MTNFKAFLGVLALAVAVGAQENYTTNWSGHRSYVVNTSASGANVTGNVRDFPLLVRLGAADSAIFLAAKADGADLRFTKANNTTRLKHQIENWNAVGRTAAIWVLVDTVYGNSSSQQLRMHWGNVSATDSSNGAAVFDTARGYRAVWHMNGGGTGNEADATINGITLTAATNAPTSNTAGTIGAARSFNGTNQYLVALNSATGPLNFPNGGPFTLSAWALRNGTGARTIVNKSDIQWGLHQNGSNLAEGCDVTGVTGTTWECISRPGALTNGEWNHIVFIRNTTGSGAGTGAMYFNGQLVSNTVTTVGPFETGRNTGANVHVGADRTAAGFPGDIGGASARRFWNGSIDEIQLSAVARDSHYVKLSFATQRAGAAVVKEPSAPYELAYQDSTKAADTLVFQTGVPVNVVPTYYGGPVDSIKITSGTATLPAGVSLNIITGVLSGTPTATFAAANRTFTAYSTLGDITRTVRISAVLGPTTNLTYSPDTATYPVGLSVVNGPTWAGRAPTKFAVSAGTLPTGLTLDTVTGVISGTPTTQAAAANFTVRATNTTGPDTATKVVRLTIGAAENFSTGWSQHRDWWLNTQPNGANVNKLVRQFPVLVRLDSTNFNTRFAQTSGGGRDLRFSKADNTTRLAHQIDAWDSAGKRASIWVLVDSVPAYGVKALRMHWGNATAANTSSGPAVFRTADGFRAVWHMNGATAASNEPDATANGMTATQTGEPPPAAGIIGGARSFANTGTTVSDYMRVLGSAVPLNFAVNANFSISAWANLTSTTAHATLVSKHDNAYALKLSSGSSWEFFEFNVDWNLVTGPAGETGVWVHLIGVQNGLDAAFYANGARVDFGISPVAGTGARNEAVDVVLGSEPTSNTAQRRPYGGLADEIRIAAVSRDTAWAKLEYQNQRPTGQTLVSFTQPVSIGGDMAARSLSFGITAKPEGEGVLFRVQGTGETMGTRLTLVDMFGRTVWSRTLAASAGTQDVLWNGQAQSGGRVSSGVYVVRAALLDASGKTIQVVERKLPLTR